MELRGFGDIFTVGLLSLSDLLAYLLCQNCYIIIVYTVTMCHLCAL